MSKELRTGISVAIPIEWRTEIRKTGRNFSKTLRVIVGHGLSRYEAGAGESETTTEAIANTERLVLVHGAIPVAHARLLKTYAEDFPTKGGRPVLSGILREVICIGMGRLGIHNRIME